MTTITATQPEVLKTWDELIDFVQHTVQENKSDLKEPITAEIDCEGMKGTRLIVSNYKGSEDGEKFHEEAEDFHMPSNEDKRLKIQHMLLMAKGNISKSFITVSKINRVSDADHVSRIGHKLFWVVKFRT